MAVFIIECMTHHLGLLRSQTANESACCCRHKLRALLFLPREHVQEAFDRLEERASGDAPRAFVTGAWSSGYSALGQTTMLRAGPDV